MPENNLLEILQSELVKMAIREQTDRENAAQRGVELYGVAVLTYPDTLLYELLEKPGFVVDGLIPTGLILFCGSQKIGKSWLMLKLCLCVSQGLPLAFQPLLRNILFCSLEEVGGAGAKPPQNLTIAAEVVQTVLPLEWSGRKRRAGFFILFPVFGGEMATAKIQTVKGLRVEIFCALCEKNTTRPLTVWTGGTDIEQVLFSTGKCATL